MRITGIAAAALATAACGSEIVEPPPEQRDTVDFEIPARDPVVVAGEAVGGEEEGAPAAASPLRIHFLGVMGFVLQRGDDVVLTAPLFTRASEATVSLGGDVFADDAAIDQGLLGVDLSNARAIVSGHAHYDHLLDVPHVMLNQAPLATLYANTSARHLLAAWAPDRNLTCTSAPPAETLPRSRVVAADDPLLSAVDWRNCPESKPAGAPAQGRWLDVEGANVRIYPICGEHPDQFLFYHFALGDVDEDACDPPSAMTRWREGNTLTFLIDFLDADRNPVFRVYYQDAPSTGPIGHPPADVLADKDVDVALLCTGTWDQVRAQPEEIVSALQPRFALSGHWEDFFRSEDSEPRPIPFMDLDAYVEHADTAMAGEPDSALLVNGVPSAKRHVLAQPGTHFVVSDQPR